MGGQVQLVSIQRHLRNSISCIACMLKDSSTWEDEMSHSKAGENGNKNWKNRGLEHGGNQPCTQSRYTVHQTGYTIQQRFR